MELNPELAAFLDLVDAGRRSGDTRPLHALAPNQARREFGMASRALDTSGEDGVQRRAVTVPTRDGAAIAARLYVPGALVSTGERPLLLYFHGGGYVVGDLDTHDALCGSLARRTPCAVLSVEYRLAPEHKFPTAVEDAVDAFKHVVASGSELAVDIHRIAVGGDSAGAGLAAVLAIMAARDRAIFGVAPVLQALLYPVTDASCASASIELFGEGYLLEAETLRWFHALYARTADDFGDWRFSPLLAPDLSRVAPAFVALAEFDPLLDEGLAYSQKLEAAGAPVTLRIYEGMTHDFLRMAALFPEAQAAHADIAAALAAAFA
ncbi:MAG TPA: alpha/beta hydrolase [Methylosinus sp.]|jgi:acetyl esterase